MKNKLLQFLLCLSSYYGHAQSLEHDRDSLKLSLQNEKKDTGRVLTLANLSFAYFESKPDTAMIMALQALELSSKIGFAKGKAVSLNRIANVYSVLGNYSKAMEVLLQALQINEEINNVDGKQRNLNNIGAIYNRQGNYQEALNYFFKAKPLAEKLENKVSLAITLENIGESYLWLKLFDSATMFTQQSYNLAYQGNYSRQMGNALNLMGEIYSATEQNTLALEYYRKSIPYLTKAETDVSLCAAFLGMGKLFSKLNNNDSTIFYAKKSLVIATEKGFTLRIRDAGRFLTSYYRTINKADSAFFYLDITKIANDSLFSQQKQSQFQSLAIDEKLRQQEIAIAELKDKIKRKHNLQYAAIAIGLIFFIILFFALSHSIVVKTKFISFFAILGLLAVFEFINLFIHPYLSQATNDSPVLMLMILIAIGALLIPLHHKLEKWITNVMTEKNKKIRLAAAKKTIQQLDSEQINSGK